MVTSKVSGMSTITRSSTPRHAMRRPEPGTTIPPATCSVSTGQKNEMSVSVFEVMMEEIYPDGSRPGYEAGWPQQVKGQQGKRSLRHHPNL